MGKKPLVFLAHNSQDKPQIRIVADALKRKGIDTWLDEEQIPPGVLFQEHLQKAIAEIDYALIFIGKSGVGQWQKIEIQSFFSKLVNSRIPVIPVLLPGVKKLPEDMVFLRELNYVQFPDDIRDQNTINKIIWGITGLQQQLLNLSDQEKIQIIQFLSQDHNFAGRGIEKKPGVCGGSACIRGTRITVWGLVESQQIGYSEADILTSYPTISATDLANAWAYAAAFPDEIANEIKENNDVMHEELTNGASLRR